MQGESSLFFMYRWYYNQHVEVIVVKINKVKKMFFIISILSILILLPITVYASGDVSGAIEDTWNTASGQIRSVVDKVVFPAIDMLLAIFFFGKLGTAYFDFRKHGQFEWSGPAILFVCLVFTLTAPLYIWQILGM